MIGPRLKDLGRWFSGGTPPSERAEYWDGNVPWLSGKDFDKTVLREPTKFTTEEGAALHSRLMPGGRSVLLLVRGMALAHGLPVARLPFDAAINQDVRGLRVGAQFDPDFVYYALVGRRAELDGYIDRAAHGTARLQESVYSHRIDSIPNLETQGVIARFLDRERERSASALAQARKVPAALDDHVRQWIRVQPEYALAAQVPLKRLTKRLNDGPFGSALTSNHYSLDYGVRIIRLGNIGRGVFRTDDDVGVSQGYGFGTLKPWLLDPDDLVLAALGDDNHPLGRAAVVPTSVLPAVNKADCYRVSCDRQVCDPSYLAWALSHGTSFDYAPVVGRGATRLRLTTETAKEIPVPVPTLADQIALMERLRRVRAPAEAGRRWSHRLSEALTAYRSSLIHEAVTGKLDVTSLSDRQMDERLHAAAENRLDEVAV